MGDLGKITITKNKDCDNKTYYSAYIYGIDAVIGGGNTRNEAKDELFGNIVIYVNYLIETNQKFKQQLEEYKNKENTSAVNSWDEMLKNCENCGLNECIGCEYTQTCVQNIKQQLAEKDIRIGELEGQFAYECECNKQLVDLQKQLEEKQKTIDEINKEFVQAVHDWKALCAEKDNEISKLQASYQQVKTQLAIQELEKVKNFIDGRTYCADYINKRIQELKGEE